MNAWDTGDSGSFRGPLDVRRAVTAVVDAAGRVAGWSPVATDVLGYRPEEIIGREAAALLADPAQAAAGPEPWPRNLSGDDDIPSTVLDLRHRDGHAVRVVMGACPLGHAGDGPAVILMAARLDEVRQWEGVQAMLRGLVTQSPVQLAIYDTDLHLVWANTAVGKELGAPLSQFSGRPADDLYPDGRVLSPGHPSSLEELMRQVLETGEPVVDVHYRGRIPADPDRGHEHVWSCSYYRLLDARGDPLGVCEEAVDITDRYHAQQRLALLVRAGSRIGGSLDVAATAHQLAEVCVPQFADDVLVDVLEPVLEGKEPDAAGLGGRRLVCVEGRVGDASPFHGRALIDHPPASAQARALASGRPVVEGAGGERREAGARLFVPLRARGTTMGLVTLVRSPGRAPFDPGELALAEELAARTAVCVDNARRYAREHAAALTLQRSLLPRHVPPQTAVEVAHRYLPADSRVGVGGDWFDVIPLSGTRVGLVVGDVVGHGLQAAATMGRLRTTVRALAQLDLAPEELLARLDDQVEQTAHFRAGEDDEDPEALGVTCLYVVYDPVSGWCSMARAGHPAPAVVHPGRGVFFPDLPPGPPLGLGGLPFESADLVLPEDSLLALFTDGLLQTHERDVDVGLDRLSRVLKRRHAPLEELCDHALADLLAGPPPDDAALLLARTRMLGADHIAVQELPPDPAAVQDARAFSNDRLTNWGLEELAFTTELIVSELVTNAIRYAGGPVHLRLIRDRTLICEVSDSGHTSPHLRYATNEDEGGRGLFLVAQMTQRWGTRYNPDGKTIWTEQALPDAAVPLHSAA